MYAVFGDVLKEPGNNLMAIAWQHFGKQSLSERIPKQVSYYKGKQNLLNTNSC
jgi:hypothetical protein